MKTSTIGNENRICQMLKAIHGILVLDELKDIKEGDGKLGACVEGDGVSVTETKEVDDWQRGRWWDKKN